MPDDGSPADRPHRAAGAGGPGMTAQLFGKRAMSILLLAVVCFTVFVIPLLPYGCQKILYNVGFTVIVAAGVASMDTHRRFFIVFAVSAIVVEWLAEVLVIDVLVVLARLAMVLYFIVVVVGLIMQIARSHRVTLRVIIEAITGYLLLGLVFALIVMVLNLVDSGAFSFASVVDHAGGGTRNYADTIYFAFVTFTTLGYGDLLPRTPPAKSLAVFVAVIGQIYLTVVIAMLVGKFLSTSQENRT